MSETEFLITQLCVRIPVPQNTHKFFLEIAHSLHYCVGSWNITVSVQGVKSLGSHFACLCQEFDFYKVKEEYYFSKRKGKYFYTFNPFYSEKSSKRAK